MTKDQWKSEAAVFVRMALYRIESAQSALYDARKAMEHAELPKLRAELQDTLAPIHDSHEALKAIEKALEAKPDPTVEAQIA